MMRLQVTTVTLFAALILSACNSASDLLEPSSIVPKDTKPVPPPPSEAASLGRTTLPSTAAPASQSTTSASRPVSATPPPQSAALAGKTRLQVAPIVGAWVEAATPLTAELQTRARARGITLAGSADQSATHVLKGYFSAITEGKDTTVIYVWDVYDPAGNRLHRINGQQKARSANGAEGWAAVSPATMQAIADQTIDQFAEWMGGRAG
jgi:hypothetical protein